MLAGLLGSVNKERVLVYLVARDTGHARAIARFFDVPLSPVQKAADALEAAGVLVAREVGTAREYRINPRYPAREELGRLIERALNLYPQELRDSLLLNRSRPRRKRQTALKNVADMSNEEVAALVCQTLAAAGVTVTLSGGACVAIWSEGKYVSNDLDFIEEGPVAPRTIVTALQSIGFTRRGKERHFSHPDTKFYVEFPSGPLMVGDERVERVSERNTSVGKLRLLSPTDCVKDRLAAFFHWNDRQGLEQALLVANAQQVDFGDIRRWSKAERNEEKFTLFEKRAALR